MSDDSNATGSVATVERTVPRLKARYTDEIKANLQQQLGLGNVMQVPALEKIVINMASVGPPSSRRCWRARSPTSP